MTFWTIALTAFGAVATFALGLFADAWRTRLGIQAAKKTPDLIPLCHPLFISGVDVAAELIDQGVEITATVKTTERTGVEMEALTAVAVAGLAVIDMIKAIDRAAVISDVRVLSKSGGRHGDWSREDYS